jgi:copper(I)-binding protein
MPRKIAGSIAMIVLVVAACGGDEGLRVEGAWARTSPAMANAGAAYMDITSPQADRLLAVSVPPSVAVTAEIHETMMMDDAGGDDTGGSMAMQQVPAIELAPGVTVSLEPGGYHIMLLDLTEPLVAGGTFELALTFEQAGEVAVTVEVRDEAP